MNPRLARYAPWPFVGIAAVLVVLILLTPVLISNGPPGPSVLTQAALTVDRVAGVSVTHFYVRALGSTVRYDAIWVGATTNFAWDGQSAINWSAVHFLTFWNASDVVVLSFASSSNPIALNITAYYTSPSGSAFYVGRLAFYVTAAPSGSGEVLYAASGTSGVVVASSTTVDNSSLPMVIVLSAASAQGVIP